jgi:Transglycosylase SLT domain
MGRIRPGRSLTAAKLAVPTILVVAGLSLGNAPAPAASAPHAAADQRPVSGPTAMAPFAATPITVPLSPPVKYIPPLVVSRHGHAAATPRVVRLPNNLHVVAAAIPLGALAAYVNAARMTDQTEPQCQVKWQVLAGIGFIESDNARSGGSANPLWNGIADPPIYGPVLDGRDGVARIPDTDHGAMDGDAQWDRAVGPMQFLPSTWAMYGADADGDGVRNPQDINDAALAAAHYLCAATPLLNTPKNLIRAIYSYNHSYAYVRAVLTVTASYMDINPAKLGINGLPKRHLIRMKLALGSLPGPAGTHSQSGPRPTPSASPTPTPSPTSSASPTPSPSPSPSPTRTPSPPPRGPVRPTPPTPTPSPSATPPPRPKR